MVWVCSYGVPNCSICRRTDLSFEAKRRLCFQAYNEAVGQENRLYLNVPYAEKNEAKALGARWDARTRRWYADNREDIAPFKRWFRRTAVVPAPKTETAPITTAAQDLDIMAALAAVKTNEKIEVIRDNKVIISELLQKVIN